MAAKENGGEVPLRSFSERERGIGVELAIRKCDALYQRQKVAFYGSIAAMLLLVLLFFLVVLLTRKSNDV